MGASMSFAIRGLGTALPPDRITQAESAEVAMVACCHDAEQSALLPIIYRQSGIQTRHMVLQHDVVHDFLNGTSLTQSEFLPSGRPEDRGPTTRQRMQRYAQEAPVLALRAAEQALEESGLAR